MDPKTNAPLNVRQAVPFFHVKDMNASLRFYVDGLGFTMTREWVPEGKDRGLDPTRPFVSNGMWLTTLNDPDGYQLAFESATDVPEETAYAEPASDRS